MGKKPGYQNALFGQPFFWGIVVLLGFGAVFGGFLFYDYFRNERKPEPGGPSLLYAERTNEPVAGEDDGPFVIAAVGDISLGRSVKTVISEGVDPFASVRVPAWLPFGTLG